MPKNDLRLGLEVLIYVRLIHVAQEFTSKTQGSCAFLGCGHVTSL